MRPHGLALILLAASAVPARGHDIPNARVDRAIQVILRPGRLVIDYEVSLSELTLTRDLRSLVGTLPGSDRQEWFARYARETAPLNAKGLLAASDGGPLSLRPAGVAIEVEEHPRYTFRYEADLPPSGRFTLRDTNYAASEGTSRLALRALDGLTLRGDTWPADVALVPITPAWQMTDSEEERTRGCDVHFDSPREGRAQAPAALPVAAAPSPRPTPPANALGRLLDRSRAPTLGLCLIALALGAAHALQPGHGKTLVAAASVGEGRAWRRGPALAVVITLTHVGGVLAVAAVLWATRSSRYGDINRGLAQGAGFVIAAVGLWRLGRLLGGYAEHPDVAETPAVPRATGGWLALGLAGGAVPCWDAVALVVLSEALGRLALGIALLAAFSLGMGAVLVLVGLAAARVGIFITGRDREGRWTRRLGLLGAGAVTAAGLFLLLA